MRKRVFTPTPPDANCLLSVADQCLRSVDYVNVIVADKQPHLTYLDMEAAITHCTKGIGIWEWASNDDGDDPDVVVASAGDIATMESLVAVAILRNIFPIGRSVLSMLSISLGFSPAANIHMAFRIATSTRYLRKRSR